MMLSSFFEAWMAGRLDNSVQRAGLCGAFFTTMGGDLLAVRNSRAISQAGSVQHR
jgi:hypothetical protein